MPAHLVFFSQPLIDLNREIAHHPELVHILNEQPLEDLEVRIAEVAAYCHLHLDDLYTPEDIDKIADMCTGYLRHKRTGIIC